MSFAAMCQFLVVIPVTVIGDLTSWTGIDVKVSVLCNNIIRMHIVLEDWLNYCTFNDVFSLLPGSSLSLSPSNYICTSVRDVNSSVLGK